MRCVACDAPITQYKIRDDLCNECMYEVRKQLADIFEEDTVRAIFGVEDATQYLLEMERT